MFIRFELRGLDGVLKPLGRLGNKKWTEELSDEVSKSAVGRIKYRLEAAGAINTGQLLQSIRRTRVKDGWKISADAKNPRGQLYGLIIEKGQRPHTIYAHRGALSFITKDGRRVVTPVVHHPGAQGTKFFSGGLEATRQSIPKIMDRVYNKTVRGYVS